MRCSSQYQNVNMEGTPLGVPKRCTGPEGHDQMHYNFTPGHRVKWPESAAIPVKPLTPATKSVGWATASQLEDFVDHLLYQLENDNQELRDEAHRLRRRIEKWVTE